MDINEVDVAIEELETRLERLRALYEQYFLGIEKIEPAIVRKDVDRRIWLLRREQIRNTAKRFRLQTIIQRYNTFQQYWGRICREIENGTYKRHIARAERTMGESELLTIAARKRLGRRRKADGEEAQEPSWQVEQDLGAALDNPEWNPLEEAKKAVDQVLKRETTPPQEVAALASPPERPPAPVAAQTRPPKEFQRLDLEMDFFDDGAKAAPAPTPAAPAAKATPKAAPAAPPPAAAPAQPAARPAAPPPAPSAAKPAAKAPPPVPARAPAPPRAAAPRSPFAQPAKPEGRDVNELHARLVEARKRTNDNREVSVDGLRKSLEAAEDRLRKQHGNRRIDFDVVIKDGKAVVKPILR